MPYNSNLALAEMAVKFVELQLPYGAENKSIDMEHRRMWDRNPTKSLDQHRAMCKTLVPGVYASYFDPRSNLEAVLVEGAFSKFGQQGNCGEQAALAFYYLVAEKKQTGVGLFAITVQDPDVLFDHAIVVLGLKREPSQLQYYHHAFYPAGWENAVWCDPWAQEWFEIKEGWLHRVDNVLRMLPNVEEAKEDALLLRCDAYYDGDEARGTLF